MPRQDSGRRRGRPGGPSDSRSASRPAAARRPAPQGAAKRTRAPREGGMPGRATALMIVLAALALGYAYPVREFLTQRSEIASLAQAQAVQRQRIAALEEEEAKWHDDRYLEIQVRKRLYWVRKGEIPLIPIWEDEVDSGRQPPPPPPAPKNWYDALWSNLDTDG